FKSPGPASPLVRVQIRVGVNNQRMGAAGDDRSIVHQRQLAATQLTRSADRVVHVGQRDIRGSSGYHILAAVGKGDLAAALECDPMLNHQELRLTARGVKGYGPGVIDDSGQG